MLSILPLAAENRKSKRSAMLILMSLLALVIWAIVRTVIVMRRDGYGRCDTVGGWPAAGAAELTGDGAAMAWLGNRWSRIYRLARRAGVPGRGNRRRRPRRSLQRPRRLRAGRRAVRRRAASSTPSCSAAPSPSTAPSTGVVHVAGFKYAGVSVQRPLHTYEQNVTATADPARRRWQNAGVGRIVFSSSAAVYGTPDRPTSSPRRPPKSPESPYGEIEAHRRVAAARPGRRRPASRTRSLRYFNVVGSGDDGPLRHQPAQPLPARLRGARRRPHAAHQRQRLRHRRRHLRARLHPRGRPRRLARRRGTAPGRRRARSSRSTTSAAATASRSARS